MPNNKRKGQPPPRYDETFKSGAIRLVTEQNRPFGTVQYNTVISRLLYKAWSPQGNVIYSRRLR